MPQLRKHDSHAARQAAYRKRQREFLAAHWDDKGLPPLATGNPANPNRARWHKAMCLIEAQMFRIQSEMEAYYDERSERWQQSDRAEEFQQKLDDLGTALELISEWIA